MLGSSTSAVVVAMVAAGHIRFHLSQFASLELGDRFPDCRVLCKVDPDGGGVEPVERPHADATNDHRVNLLAFERRQGSAHSVTVMLVGVHDRPAITAVRVY